MCLTLHFNLRIRPDNIQQKAFLSLKSVSDSIANQLSLDVIKPGNICCKLAGKGLEEDEGRKKKKQEASGSIADAKVSMSECGCCFGRIGLYFHIKRSTKNDIESFSRSKNMFSIYSCLALRSPRLSMAR